MFKCFKKTWAIIQLFMIHLLAYFYLFCHFNYIYVCTYASVGVHISGRESQIPWSWNYIKLCVIWEPNLSPLEE